MINIDLLVEQFQDKNQIAFEKLYDMYSKSIHGVVYNIVKDAAYCRRADARCLYKSME